MTLDPVDEWLLLLTQTEAVREGPFAVHTSPSPTPNRKTAASWVGASLGGESGCPVSAPCCLSPWGNLGLSALFGHYLWYNILTVSIALVFVLKAIMSQQRYKINKNKKGSI